MKEIKSCSVIYSKQKSITCENCGKVALENFSITFNMVKESMHYNSCLNKKIAITKNGFIKNCPSSSTSWGHVKDIKIKDVISS